MVAALGRALQWFRAPGLVQETRYDASIADLSVEVRTSGEFTVVTLNGVDAYFARTTGRLEGVGVRETGHRWRVVRRNGRLRASVWCK